MNYTLSLGGKIRLFRERSKKSQFYVEIDVNASPGSLSRIESNKVNPNKETIISTAKVLNLTPEQTASLFDIYIIEKETKLDNLYRSTMHNSM